MIYTPADIPQRPNWKAFAKTYAVGDQMVITGDYRAADVFIRSMRTARIYCTCKKINEHQRVVTRIR